MNERAWCVPIRSDGTRLDPIEVGTAGTAQTVRIPIAKTLRAVLTAGCESFILVHSHPGDLTPSAPDKLLVRRFLRAATYLGMTLVDSLIEGPRGTLSMVAEGYLDPLPIQSLTAAASPQ
jgi:DNA repair protein RadC